MARANAHFADALSRGDAEAAIRSDDDFHSVAVVACENDVIAQVLEQVTPVLRRLEHLRFSSLSGRDSIAQHEQIIELCRDGDAVAAADATERNWQTLSQIVEQADDHADD